MSTDRARRVAKQVLHEISTIVELEMKDPRLSVVTFTDARMSADLRRARIWFSCLDPEHNRSSSEQALARAGGYLRREIGRRLRLRYVPDLSFEYDDSTDRADRISRLLRGGEPPHGERH
ncbi:MAG: 30S ribosome-binding factor RbfA [Deltaproteobacteria bacterium]|nr:MAG: 30S ribosome-binding factor RbfA [Deltaproteobacteria bacterium]